MLVHRVQRLPCACTRTGTGNALSAQQQQQLQILCNCAAVWAPAACMLRPLASKVLQQMMGRPTGQQNERMAPHLVAGVQQEE